MNESTRVCFCGTSVNTQESMSERMMRRKTAAMYRQKVTVRKQDGLRIRRESQRMFWKSKSGGKESFVCRCVVSAHSRDDTFEEAGFMMRAVKSRTFGRFRMNVTLRRREMARETWGKGCDRETGHLLDETSSEDVDAPEVETDVPVVPDVCDSGLGEENEEVVNDGEDDTVHPEMNLIVRRRNRNRTGVQIKRKRRRMECLDNFIFFGGRVNQAVNADTENVAITEEEKFRRSIMECMKCKAGLMTTWSECPYLRCSGASRRNQKFVCMSGVRMEHFIEDGRVVLTVVLSLVIEEETRKVRNLSLKRERVSGSDGEVVKDETVLFCSCDIRWEDGEICSSQCWHCECLKDDNDAMNGLKELLECGIIRDHFVYFGEILTARDGVEEMTAIQLEHCEHEDLVKRGNRISKRWSPWLVVDLTERMVIAVIWRGLGNGREETRMVCTMCRADMNRRCRHEVECDAERVHAISQLSDGEEAVSSDEYESGDGNVRSVEQETGVAERTHGGIGNVEGTEFLASQLAVGGEFDSDSGGGGKSSESGDSGNESVGVDTGGGNAVTGIAVNEPSGYYPPDSVRRSFILCPAEEEKAKKLTDLIENESSGTGSILFCDPCGSRCGGLLLQHDGTKANCTGKKTDNCRDIPRSVTLFTLHHGELCIVVLDWVCSHCRYENRYSGFTHGLFPAAHGIAYTIELMYFWLAEMCSNTRSFRSVYETSRKLQFSPSYQRRFMTGRLVTEKGRHKPNRRYANNAMRKFIGQIDVDGRRSSSQLYTCKKCEVRMDSSDFKQLGMDPVKNEGLKRLRSVVIDAKVVPLLKECGISTDNHDVVTGVAGLRVRVVKNRETQAALKLFIKTVRTCLERKRKKDARLRRVAASDASDVNSDDGFLVRSGHLLIRLGGMHGHFEKKGKKDQLKVTEYVRIITWYVNNSACLCPGGDRAMDGNCGECRTWRTKMEKTAGSAVVTSFLSSVFKVCHVETVDLPEVEESDEDDTDDKDTSVSSLKDTWVRTAFSFNTAAAEQLDAIMEVARFCLVEPLHLGFFPFMTNHIDHFAAHEQRGDGDGDQDFEDDRVNPENWNADERRQLLDGSVNEEVREKDMLDGIACESIGVHRELVTALRAMAGCNHDDDGGYDTEWVCTECVCGVANIQGRVTAQNCILGRYIADVMRVGHRNPSFTRLAAGVISDVLETRIVAFEAYIAQLGNKMHPSAKQYWRQYGYPDPSPIPDREDVVVHSQGAQSFYVFPGRPRRRHGIDFEKIDRGECTKNYFKGTSAIPSFLTVQCACAHPKLLGFVILRECESLSAVLSALLTHFAIPPRTVWYDNACNCFDSAITRVPWLLRWTTFVVDRFHFAGHTCCDVFNGSRQNVLDGDRSVAAEIINAIIDKGMSHITYLDGRHVIPFMKTLFAYLNAIAMVKDRLGRNDLEDEDVMSLLRGHYICRCTHCCEQHLFDYHDGVSAFSTDNVRVELVNSAATGTAAPHGAGDG